MQVFDCYANDRHAHAKDRHKRTHALGFSNHMAPLIENCFTLLEDRLIL